MNRLTGAATVIVNGLAPESKTMPSSVVGEVIDTFLLFDIWKVAVSLGPFGTVSGVQLAAVFQSLDTGARSDVALPASAARVLPSSRIVNKAQRRGNRCINDFVIIVRRRL